MQQSLNEVRNPDRSGLHEDPHAASAAALIQDGVPEALTRPVAPAVLDALGASLDTMVAALLRQSAEMAGQPFRPAQDASATERLVWPAPEAVAASGDRQDGAGASADTTDAGSAPDLAAMAVKAAAPAGGYDTATNTLQWNIPAMFGGSAAKAIATLSQFNGQGVHVADYDDGIDKTVKALMTRYDASRELVINGQKADPGILSGSGAGVHGTATAGEIIADGTTNGGTLTGLAYGAQLTAVNIFSGVAANNFVTAIRLMANFDVTNNSWGWSTKWADSASTAFGAAFQGAIKTAVDTGRAGLGTVVVHAAGNEWSVDHRDLNTSEFSADRHVVNVAAIGSNGDVSYYSNRGASLLVGASSGGSTGQYIATTDRTGAAGYAAGDVTKSFNGTSAAAPQVTAIVADMLSANSKLGWRDVQNILALTANDVETKTFTKSAVGQMAYGWSINGASGVNGGGYHFSNDVGFGIANGHDAVREAEVWNYFNPVAQTSANELRVSASVGATAVSAGVAGTSFSFKITQSISVENVSLTFNISSRNLDNLSVTLTGPSGTKSLMLDTSTGAAVSASNFTWSLGSHAFLGELSAGSWTVTFKDTVAADAVKLNSATLELFGSSVSAAHVFHYTDEAAMMLAYDPSRLVIKDASGVDNWLDLAPTTGAADVNLATGATSTLAGKAFATIAAGTTINKVTLGDGTATVRANNNGDTVVAGHGAATILGGLGNDTFYSGWANDVMTGGAGSDVFAFSHAGFGKDVITDFVKGQDKISLKGLAATFAQLKIVDTGSQITIGGITAAATDTIILQNTKNQHLAASDFVFA